MGENKNAENGRCPGRPAPAVSGTGEESKEFEDACYQAYQLDWMMSRGYSLGDLFEVFTELVAEDVGDDEGEAPFVVDSSEKVLLEAECARERFWTERGFGGSELFASREEFLENEFRDGAYMCRLLGQMPDPVGKAALWRKYVSPELPEISRVLTVSTGHIREETAMQMDGVQAKWRHGLSVYRKEGFGWWVYIPRDKAGQNGFEGLLAGLTGVPGDLRGCMGLAAKNGCGWLCLDCDGPRMAGLPYYYD